MANEYAVNAADLLAVADAIREKGETSEALAFPDGFVSAVQKISTGVELNFSVIAYASADSLPETAEENTIAVITDTEITGYAFSAEEPQTPAEGMMWFKTGCGGAVKIQATENNEIYLYPKAGMQYVNSEWNSKSVFVGNNGVWVTPKQYLYEKGEKFSEITGGWGKYSRYAAKVDELSASFLLTAENSGYQAAGIQTIKQVDITPYSKINFVGTVSVDEEGGSSSCGIQTNQAVGYKATEGVFIEHVASVAVPSTTGDFLVTLNIADYTGLYYVGVLAGDDIYIYDVWME